MKLFLTIIIVALLPGKTEAQQNYVNEIFDTYFRANPFDTGFNVFYQRLSADPALSDKSIQKRTDSTLFSFKGAYENFKRGNFKFTRAEVRLEEIEIETSESLHTKDTLIQYQIICYCMGGKSGLTIAKKVYDNFYKEYHNAFLYSNKEAKEPDETAGAVRHYFSSNLPISPVTTLWGRKNENESVFSVAVRMKLKENALDLFKFSDLKPAH